MIPAEHPHLFIAAATHPGMKAKPNEDRYSISSYRMESGNRTPVVLALLADGIGGHRAGEVAADLAINHIRQYVEQNSSGEPVQVLKAALTHANQAILAHAKGNASLVGMGTTCVCAWVIGPQLYAVYVGDSRLYLLRGSTFTCLTTDHTWIQEALANGLLTPDQIRGHPNAHIIRRFLGSTNVVNPDTRLRLSPEENDAQAEANQGMLLAPGDRLLLCTDGLTDLVKDAEIHEVIRTRPLESALTHLVNIANQRGGHDNITILTLEVPQPPHMTRPLPPVKALPVAPPARAPRTALSWLMLFLVLLAILMTLGLLVYAYLN